jgi:hypothetical protein
MVMTLLLPQLSSFKVTHTKRDKSYALTTQAMYCTNNVTLRRDCATTVTVERQYVLHILSVYLWPMVSSLQCACAILSSVAYPALQ